VSDGRLAPAQRLSHPLFEQSGKLLLWVVQETLGDYVVFCVPP
jgi:hypothetical protein